MKIVYYDPNTKEITMTAHRQVPGVQDPYIEISDNDIKLLEKENLHFPSFFVENGQLHKRPLPPPPIIKNRVLDYCYAIPIVNSNSINLLCQQNKSNKTLSIRLQNSNDIDLTRLERPIFLVACKNNDAHLPLWHLKIPENTISECALIYNYSGEDDFRLYTYKIFENYLHEQID